MRQAGRVFRVVGILFQTGFWAIPFLEHFSVCLFVCLLLFLFFCFFFIAGTLLVCWVKRVIFLWHCFWVFCG